MKLIRAAVAALILTLTLSVGVALGHQAKSISASAVCGGATTVVVKADVFGGVRLIVKVDGNVIFDEAQNTQDQSVRTFTIATTTSPGGHSASARTSDQNGSVSTEFTTPQPCPTPKPTPTPTPPPSPTPTPSHTPRPTPSIPNVTPPPTSTAANADKNGSDSGALAVLIGAILIVLFVLAVTPHRRDPREN